MHPGSYCQPVGTDFCFWDNPQKYETFNLVPIINGHLKRGDRAVARLGRGIKGGGPGTGGWLVCTSKWRLHSNFQNSLHYGPLNYRSPPNDIEHFHVASMMQMPQDVMHDLFGGY